MNLLGTDLVEALNVDLNGAWSSTHFTKFARKSMKICRRWKLDVGSWTEDNARWEVQRFCGTEEEVQGGVSHCREAARRSAPLSPPRISSNTNPPEHPEYIDLSLHRQGDHRVQNTQNTKVSDILIFSPLYTWKVATLSVKSISFPQCADVFDPPLRCSLFLLNCPTVLSFYDTNPSIALDFVETAPTPQPTECPLLNTMPPRLFNSSRPVSSSLQLHPNFFPTSTWVMIIN